MSSITSWDELPYEIVFCILQNVAESLEQPYRKHNLANLQRVCKSWSKAAQKLLYTEIILDESTDKLFLKTIDQISPSLGVLVKKVKITIEFGETNRMEDVFPPFDKHCPNLEEIFAEADSDKAELYSFLLLSARINNLQRIDEKLELKKALSTYPFVAFKYRNTLMELYVDFDYHIGDYDSKKTLIDQLQHFRSLKHVIITLFIFSDTVEKILDNCPKTVDTLTFRLTQEDGNWTEPDYNTVIPISNIKNLRISDNARFGPSHLKYIKSKLNALESFEAVPTALAQDLDVQFLDLCASIQNYSVGIAMEQNDETRNRIESLIKRSKKDGEFCESKVFELNFDYVADLEDGQERPYDFLDWNLYLARTKKAKAIRLYYIKDGSEDPLAGTISPNVIVDWLQLYSPDTLIMSNIEPMNNHYIYLVVNRLQPGFDTVASIRRYFAWISKDRSWKVFDGAISVLQNQKEKRRILSFSEMIFCDVPSPLPQFENQICNKFSCLQIARSMIYHKILHTLSRKLSVIDTLVFDSSWILMDDDKYTLKIFLPYTRLRRLGIRTAPFQPTDTEDEYERTILDNDILLQATSNVGKYILKIETNNDTFASHRQGHKNTRNLSEKEALNIKKGTDDSFLIWIRCMNLEKFAIDTLEEGGRVWEPRYENVSALRLAADSSK